MEYKILVASALGLVFGHATLNSHYPYGIVQNESIDAQIKQLQQERDFYLSRAYRRDLNSMRWQFDSQYYLDARRAYEQSELDRQKAAEIQKKIDKLEAEKGKQ